MALFKTHSITGCLTSGVLATILLAAGLCSPTMTVLYLFLGSVGSVFPDIDSDNSVPLKLAFTLGSVFFAFLLLFANATRWSVMELLTLWVVTFLVLRYIVLGFFIHATVHRGILHSLPAAVMFFFAMILVLHKGFRLPAGQSWLGGTFFFGGYLLHLFMDELTSLNLFGLGNKKSLGTACKLYDKANWRVTLSVYAALLLFFFFLPACPYTMHDFGAALSQKILYLPEKNWFDPQP